MLELILCALGLLIVQIMAHYPMNLQHVQFFYPIGMMKLVQRNYIKNTKSCRQSKGNSSNILDLNDPGDGARC